MRLLSEFLADDVQGAAGFEPFYLLVVVGVVEQYAVTGTVFMVQYHGYMAAGSEGSKAKKIYGIVFLHFIVVLLVGKGETEHTLLFQVGLMYACEALNDNSANTEVTRLHSCVLA